MITTYEKGTREYKALEAAAALAELKSPNGYKYFVMNTYFDFGQDWLWTTIVAEKPNGDSYQALDPREHAAIITGEINEIVAAINAMFEDKFCPDKNTGDQI